MDADDNSGSLDAAPRAAFVVSGPGSDDIALCRRCKRDVLPEGFKPSGIAKNALRKAADGMVDAETADPKAERIKARKARKQSHRQLTKEIGFLGLVTLHLRTELAARAVPPDDDCPRCAKMQADAARRRSITAQRIAGAAVA